MKDFNAIETGKRIKELRLLLGFSQCELGAKIGIAQNTISQYEKGLARPSVEIIVKLAQVLETSCDYLMGIIDY